MIASKEGEKLFLYCLEELRLLIEKPYENDFLTERLSAIKNNLEILHQQILQKKR